MYDRCGTTEAAYLAAVARPHTELDVETDTIFRVVFSLTRKSIHLTKIKVITEPTLRVGDSFNSYWKHPVDGTYWRVKIQRNGKKWRTSPMRLFAGKLSLTWKLIEAEVMIWTEKKYLHEKKKPDFYWNETLEVKYHQAELAIKASNIPDKDKVLRQLKADYRNELVNLDRKLNEALLCSTKVPKKTLLCAISNVRTQITEFKEQLEKPACPILEDGSSAKQSSIAPYLAQLR